MDDAFPALGDRVLQAAAGRETGRAVAQLGVAGEKLSVRLHQRVEASRAAPDQRIKILEVARQHGNRDHAVERAIGGGPPARKHEERGAETRQSRRHHIADIGPGRAGHMRTEKIPVAHIEVGRHLRELAGNDRAAVTVDEKDRPQLRQRIDDLLQAIVQARLVLPEGVVRHAAHDLVDLGNGPLDGLEDLERVLVQDIERALDPIVGDRMFVAIVEPGGEAEKQDRQHDTCNHHQLQQSYC